MDKQKADQLVGLLYANWGPSLYGNGATTKMLWRERFLTLEFEPAKAATMDLIETCAAKNWPPMAELLDRYRTQLDKRARQRHRDEHEEAAEWTPEQRAYQIEQSRQMIQRLARAKRMP